MEFVLKLHQLPSLKSKLLGRVWREGKEHPEKKYVKQVHALGWQCGGKGKKPSLLMT